MEKAGRTKSIPPCCHPVRHPAPHPEGAWEPTTPPAPLNLRLGLPCAWLLPQGHTVGSRIPVAVVSVALPPQGVLGWDRDTHSGGDTRGPTPSAWQGARQSGAECTFLLLSTDHTLTVLGCSPRFWRGAMLCRRGWRFGENHQIELSQSRNMGGFCMDRV